MRCSTWSELIGSRSAVRNTYVADLSGHRWNIAVLLIIIEAEIGANLLVFIKRILCLLFCFQRCFQSCGNIAVFVNELTDFKHFIKNLSQP